MPVNVCSLWIVGEASVCSGLPRRRGNSKLSPSWLRRRCSCRGRINSKQMALGTTWGCTIGAELHGTYSHVQELCACLRDKFASQDKTQLRPLVPVPTISCCFQRRNSSCSWSRFWPLLFFYYSQMDHILGSRAIA